jgi:hypothetical protein
MSAGKRNIRDMLPEYVRNTLSGEDRKRVDEALAVDASLQEYCRELKDYFAKIKSLPGLSAPEGFAQGVMRRINEAPEKKSFLSKLFIPLNVKLPLELAGVAVTVAFLIIVYHPFRKMTEPVPGKNLEMAMSVPAEQKQEKQIPAKPARSFAAETKTAGRTAPVSASSRRHAKETATDEKMPQVALAQKSVEAEQQFEERTYAAAAPAPKAMAAAPVGYSAPREELEKKKRDVAAGLMEQTSEARRSQEQAFAPSHKTEQEIPVQLVLNVGYGNQDFAELEKSKKDLGHKARAEKTMEPLKQPVQLTKAIEQAVGAAGGSIVAREQDKPKKGMVRYTIKVPSPSYDSFASGLAKLGRLSVTREPTGRSRTDIDIELIIREIR